MEGVNLAEITKLAVKAAGGSSAVARKITEVKKREKPFTPQAVDKWFKSHCPSEHVLLLESMQTEYTRHDLRPDIYPEEQKTPLAS